MSAMQKILIVGGLILIAVGLLWPWLAKIPIGRLPGDIVINKPNIKIYIPIATMVALSALLSLIVWIVQKFK